MDFKLPFVVYMGGFSHAPIIKVGKSQIDGNSRISTVTRAFARKFPAVGTGTCWASAEVPWDGEFLNDVHVEQALLRVFEPLSVSACRVYPALETNRVMGRTEMFAIQSQHIRAYAEDILHLVVDAVLRKGTPNGNTQVRYSNQVVPKKYWSVRDLQRSVARCIGRDVFDPLYVETQLAHVDALLSEDATLLSAFTQPYEGSPFEEIPKQLNAYFDFKRVRRFRNGNWSIDGIPLTPEQMLAEVDTAFKARMRDLRDAKKEIVTLVRGTQ